MNEKISNGPNLMHFLSITYQRKNVMAYSIISMKRELRCLRIKALIKCLSCTRKAWTHASVNEGV
jgi:hypothetical protein